jgi:SH3 domain protein
MHCQIRRIGVTISRIMLLGYMKMRIVLTVLLFLFATTAAAESRFVDDQLVITMRTGKGNTYQILRTFPSGTVLELLENDGDYSRVRSNEGTEGWVLTQYLTKTPIAKVRLVRAEQQLERLREDKTQLQQQLATLKEEKSALDKEHGNLGSEAEKLHSELEKLRKVAARPIELAQENEDLKDKTGRLQQEIEQLQDENSHLQDRSQRDWFLTGAGVLFGGIFLGLILPRLRRKKRGMFE